MRFFTITTELRPTAVFMAIPSYKNIKNILYTGSDQIETPDKDPVIGSYTEAAKNNHALTRGAD